MTTVDMYLCLHKQLTAVVLSCLSMSVCGHILELCEHDILQTTFVTLP